MRVKKYLGLEFSDSRFISVAFVGVHGIGKSTTAEEIARILGYGLVELEAIDEVEGLVPDDRQLLFLSKFVYLFLKQYKGNVIYTSHPLMVLPYTEYLSKSQTLAEIVRSVIERIRKPVTYMVYLKATDINVVKERIMSRARNLKVKNEELNDDYIMYIDKRVGELLREMPHLYRNLIEIDGCLELDQRVEEILVKM